MALDNTDFTLPRNSYATFDALTLKQLIKDRLTKGGVFTDQNYEGSNLSAIIDVIAYSYHTLLFYLNQTSSESTFSESSIYENMNRIVKLIGYKPTGYKTALLSFQANANANLTQGVYTIKRYSFFNINGIKYSFLKDITFAKNTNDAEYLEGLSTDNILYQGSVFEYTPQTAIGEDFETITLVVKDTITNKPINIEDSSIGVFVKFGSPDADGISFSEVDSIFNAKTTSFSFEKRINENGFYEIKFGNGVYGRRLNAGDTVYIYYLKSDGLTGIVSANQLNNNSLNTYATPQFNDLTKNTYNNTTLLNGVDVTNIIFSNNSGSSSSAEPESVDKIRQNAPKMLFSQNRIVTSEDLETYINKNYSNIVSSIKVVNNLSYIDNVIKYYYSLGLDRPNDDSRVLFNEVNFSTCGQTNNVYVFMVPGIKAVDENNNLFFLSQSQKSEILNGAESIKMLNMEIIPQDPVYTAVTIGLTFLGDIPTQQDVNDTVLVVEKSLTNKISTQKIIENVNNIFVEYFNKTNTQLGLLIDTTALQTKILQLPGVVGIKTRKVSNGRIFEVPYINLIIYNPVYPDVDIVSTSNSTQLPYFKYPFLLNSSILNKIVVENVNA
jgi:hypothetical protein